MTRRTLLAASVLSAARVRGANERVNVTLVGLGGRGQDHARFYSEVSAANITGICDVNQAARERGSALVEKLTGRKPKEYADMRRVFDDKSVDAVSMATPNHWHALGTIWACQAGKDVYCEKPASHNIYEGGQMIAAARKYGRMVQVGSQSRSIAHKIEAIRLLNEGVIGKVYLAKGLCYKRRKSIGHKPDMTTPPPGVDWDRFLGPAPLRPFNENRFAYNWHWFWDTGNGDLGNQGIHEVDVARWGLGVTHPTKVSSIGGKFMFDDDQETPNTLNSAFEFNVGGKKKMMEFEVRHWYSNHEAGINGERPGNTIGNTFYGSDGYLVIDNYNKYYSFLGKDHKPGPSRTERDTHFENFINVMRDRKRENLNAEIEEGAMSCTLMHLANISYRVGRTLHWDEKTWTVKNDPEANRLLTRQYRAPYIVPAKV